MHGSEWGRCTNFPVKFVFINPTFCVGSGVRLFQGRFCAYATVIIEAQGDFLLRPDTENHGIQ